jgi:hypothetical protein
MIFLYLKGGYVPGEGIVFNVAIDNKSNMSIIDMTVKLVQSMKFHATHKSRSCSRIVAAIRYPGKVNARTKETWNNSVLIIPPVCSSSNGTCRIIEVSYTVIFNFDTSGFAISKDLKIPLIVGTIPLRVNTKDVKLDDHERDLASSLPSYEACMFGRNKSSEIPNDFETKGEFVESDESTFKPFYPYYKDFTVI